MAKPLAGARILVTRPVHQAEKLCRLIADQGGIAVRFPTIEIVSVAESGFSSASNHANKINEKKGLSDCDWLIFTSINAVNFACKAIGGTIAPFSVARIAAIGLATAQALENAGLSVDLVPNSGDSTEALLAMPALQTVRGNKIVVVRGQGGREQLAQTLRVRGAQVEYWEVYRRCVPNVDPTEVRLLLDRNQLAAVAVTSCEALQNLVVMIGIQYLEKLIDLPLVVISDRIRRYAVEMGFKCGVVTTAPADDAILASLIALLHGEESG